MGIKKGLFLSIFCCVSYLVAQSVRLPSNFYAFKDNSPTTTLSFQDGNPIFYIVVSEYSGVTNKDTQKELLEFTKNIQVPAHFFGTGLPQKNTEPVILFLDWEERENLQIRKKAGQKLAQGLDALTYRFKNGKFIVVGHGQGGNVINHATNSIRNSIDLVVQLATPIFPHAETGGQDPYSDFIPNKNKINRIYNFYSEQSFPALHPTLHPQYEHTYNNTVHPKLSNVLLLVNNKHPLPGDMLKPLVGKKLLPLCQKLHSTFRSHKNLVAHISNTRPQTDLMVALKDCTLCQASRKRTTQSILQERMISNAHIKEFANLWGRPLALSLNEGEKSRKQYESIKQLSSHKRG